MQRKGERLAAAVPGEVFHFEVIGSGAAEPIGLPGGTVLVLASFFLRAENEDAFAGMLSHAMGHVVLRHGFKEARPTADAAIPLIFIGGWIGAHADPAGSQTLIPIAFRARHQRYEEDADLYGAELAQRAGFPTPAAPTAGEEYARLQETVRTELNGKLSKPPSLRRRNSH